MKIHTFSSRFPSFCRKAGTRNTVNRAPSSGAALGVRTRWASLSAIAETVTLPVVLGDQLRSSENEAGHRPTPHARTDPASMPDTPLPVSVWEVTMSFNVSGRLDGWSVGFGRANPLGGPEGLERSLRSE